MFEASVNNLLVQLLGVKSPSILLEGSHMATKVESLAEKLRSEGKIPHIVLDEV